MMQQQVIAQREKPDTTGCITYSHRENIIPGEIYMRIEEDSVIKSQKILSAISGQTKLLYNPDEMLRPVIENGLLNANLLLEKDFAYTDILCLIIHSGNQVFLDAELTIPAEPETSCILFGSMELISENANQRVFSIFNSLCPFDGQRVFYLILQNDQKTNSDPDFLNGAYISCLKHWYSKI
jgi:hypothetical protein